MKSSLNLKQERFAIEYLVDLNGTRAAIRAGYSGRSASTIAERLLRKVEIQKLISERRDAISKNLEIDNEWFVKKAVKLYETAIALDQNGRMSNGAAAAKALELVGRHLGLFAEKSEPKTTAEIVVYKYPANGRYHVEGA